MNGFKIICNKCGQACEVDKDLTTGRYKGTATINVDHDVEIEKDDLSFFYEIVCGRCGNTLKLEI